MTAKPRRVVWTPRARRDLINIGRYFARVGSIEVADSLLREIAATARRMAERPFTGRSRDELAQGLRSVLVHPHVVFYRVSERARLKSCESCINVAISRRSLLGSARPEPIGNGK